ncbi:isopeptide-forming domain-containing fimbrial protein [Levilactobacillus brevis]|uniref:isopeptide-forming domain-containing fimbrial protein n=1 Tax=Levilactobacillus brevis TaxID=1580 RepID=UPI0031D22B52
MDDKYKRAKYLVLLGVSLFSFSVLQNQATTTYADTGDTIRSSVVNDGSQEKKSSGGSEDSSQKISNSDSQVTDANSDGTGKTNASDTSKIQNPVTKSASINDISGSDGSNDTVNTGTNSAGRVSSIGVNDGQAETEDTTTPVVAAPKNLVVIKKNDSSVHLDNQLKISTDSTANIKKVTSSNPDNSTYDDTTKIVTITAPTATDAVTAEYGVVGTYKGKNITAKVTINNLVKHTEDHPAPSNLPANEIQIKFHPDFGGGIETYNVAQDEVTIAFFDEQGNQVTIDNDGYITVGSLNGPSTSTMGNEYVNYDNPNTSTYITEDSVVQYQANPVTGIGDAYVGTSSDFTDKLGAPTSENGAVTFQLSGSSFTFLNGTTRYTLKNSNHHWSYALTTFNSATVAPAQAPKPVLSVDQTSAKAGDTVNYTLNQQVNTLGEDTLLRYQSWTQTVTLPSEVTYQQGSLLDSNGNVISDAVITYDAKTNQVSVTLPSDYLQNTMPLTGETYSLKIETKVNAGVSNGENGPATGDSTIDSAVSVSNNVNTVYMAPVTSNPSIINDELEHVHILTVRLLNLSTGKTISENSSKEKYQTKFNFRVPNLQKKELVVIWNEFNKKKLMGTMPDHDLTLTIPYSKLSYRENRTKGLSVVWAYDDSGKIRVLQLTFPDDNSIVTLYKFDMFDDGKYITEPTGESVTILSKGNSGEGQEYLAKHMFILNDNQQIKLQNGGSSSGFFRDYNGSLYSYSFRYGKIIVKKVNGISAIKTKHSTNIMNKKSQISNDGVKRNVNEKVYPFKDNYSIKNTITIKKNVTERGAKDDKNRNLPQTNGNDNYIISLIGLSIFFIPQLSNQVQH